MPYYTVDIFYSYILMAKATIRAARIHAAIGGISKYIPTFAKKKTIIKRTNHIILAASISTFLIKDLLYFVRLPQAQLSSL